MASKNEWRLVRLTADFATFCKGDQIIIRPITPEAAQIVRWNWYKLPAND